jgi:outer membrane usher protein
MALLAATGAAAGWVAPAQAEPAPMQAAAAQSARQELWLAVQINRAPAGEPVLLMKLADGRLLAQGKDLARWRLRVPATPAAHDGEAFYALDELPGLHYTVDEPNQVLMLSAPADLFDATALRGRAAVYRVPAPAPIGGFFNYQLSAQRSAGRTSASGLFEAGTFNAWGVGTTRFLARDTAVAQPSGNVVRLDTTWTRDRPETLASLRLGDSISSPGDWGRSVRFAGVQWATDFSTQPGFVPFALPGYRGEALLPSTVELYVDNALRMTREVPSGPFSIQDLPVVTGSGFATVVVQDLLGHQQSVTLPYYASPRLLPAGVNQFSYEAGFVRDNYGIASNDYGRFVAVGTRRHGFSDGFTGEVHAELLRNQQTVGVSGAYLMPLAGIVRASVAASRSDRVGRGELLALGFERQSAQLSIGGTLQLASAHFVNLGLPTATRAPRAIAQAYLSYATAGYGALGASYTRQDHRDAESVGLVGVNYSITLGDLGYLTLSALRVSGDTSAITYALVFTRALDLATRGSVSLGHDADGSRALLDVQRSLPVGDGFGYRVQAGAGEDARFDAGFSAQSDIGTYAIDSERRDGQTSVRADVGGGIVALGGEVFLSRRMEQSFGVVQIPGFPHVQIYADNQAVATTDAAGNALVPRLRAYQDNPIRIEQADLPLDAQIDSLEQQAVPYRRSGVVVKFPVRHAFGGTIRVVLDDGKPLPAGAVAQIVGQPATFPSGLDGAVYLTGLAPSNRIAIAWREQRCELLVPFPTGLPPMPQLGTYVCAGVTP